jgi:spore coat protein U-like protein
MMASLALVIGPASAQTCSFAITDMVFDSDIDTLSGVPATSNAELSYSCSGGSGSERILICAHLGAGSVEAGGNSRRMLGGNSHLNYQLYQAGDYVVTWGSAATGNPPPPIALALDGGSGAGSRTIYGRVFGGQQAAAAASYMSPFTGTDVEVRYRIADDNDCSAMAGTQSSPVSFSVQAGVKKNCLVSTEPVSFGEHGNLLSNIDATGMISVTCTPATNYSIKLNGGNAATAPAARKMTMGAREITYGLYRDVARDEPWGDTEGTSKSDAGDGSSQPHVVYGRVPPQPTPKAGNYADVVVVAIDY